MANWNFDVLRYVRYVNFVLRKAVSKFNRFLQVFFVGDMVLVVFDFVVLGVFVVCFVLNVVLGPGPVFFTVLSLYSFDVIFV